MKARHLVIAVVLFTLLAGSATAVLAQVAPQYTRQFGSDTYDHAKKIVADPGGNVYVAGYTHGVINAPSLPGANTNAGGKDAFVAKFDPQGALLWVTQFGSSGDDSIEGIFLHIIYGTPSSLYVAGSTNGSMPGGPQRGTNTLAGGVDLFVAEIRLDSGAIRWVRQYGTAGDDRAYGVVADQNAIIYVVGSTTGRLDGVTEPGATNDAFIMKLDGSGNSLDIRQFNVASAPLDTVAYAVAIESRSYPYIYITGCVHGNEEGSIFVAKFDTYLNPPPENLGPGVVTLGGRKSGSDSDTGSAITIDGSGNVIVAGSTLGAFEGNASAGGEDIVVVKLTARLAPVWTHQYGTDAVDTARGVAVDAEGSIYVTGVTGFPSGPGLDGQAHLGDYDIFLTRFAPDGRRLFTRQVGTEVRDWTDGIAVDPAGNIYIVGYTAGAMGDQNFGLWDAVLIKYGSDGLVPPAPRPVTQFFINGLVRELPSGSPLSAVTITVKDWGGKEVASGSTGTSGQFSWQVPAAGRYSIHKLKIGYTAQVDPDVVDVTEAAPTATLVSTMQKIVVKTQMSFRKGYSTVRFTKLPSGDRSVNTVFGQYAGNPYVGLIFSFDRPMQYLLLSNNRTVGNIKALEFGRSYMIYTSRAFVLDTTYWVGADTAPPATTYRGKVQY